MEKILLGRTGLKVSVAGLGAGGHSRLGLPVHGLEHSSSLVQTAYENGVNFFDTATAYGTQAAVSRGLKDYPRDSYILSTKFPYRNEEGVRTPLELEQTLEESLRDLNTDYIDIYHLHGVRPEDYRETVEVLMPALKKAQAAGKIRWLGITEVFGTDTSHIMLKQALPQDLFDVVMVGYSLLNPSALYSVLPLTREKDTGVLCMFAVRSALSNPRQLKVDIMRILERGQADPELLTGEDPLGFLIREDVASSIPEAAYRFCRHTPGIHVILTGTGNPAHLEENLRSIQGPPLPEDTLEKLRRLFGQVDCVSGQ